MPLQSLKSKNSFLAVPTSKCTVRVQVPTYLEKCRPYESLEVHILSDKVIGDTAIIRYIYIYVGHMSP